MAAVELSLGTDVKEIQVSIVVPFYNRADMLADVITALLQQSHPSEIIVVDDGSTDNTAAVAKSYQVRYFYQENRGPAAARNKGFQVSTGRIVAFTDSDCIARPDWIEKLLEGFTRGDNGVVAGSYSIANPQRLLPRLIHEEIKGRHAGFKTHIRAFGAYNVAVKRNVFEDVGGFDESYRTASGEDNDLSYRILASGNKILFKPDALVSHHHTEKFGKYLKEQYRHGYWRMKLYKAHRDMMKGDDYTQIRDILESPLSLLVLAALPLLLTRYWFVELILLVALYLLSLPAAVRIAVSKKDPVYLLLAALSVPRAFARMFGMVMGIWRFWFKPNQGQRTDVS